MLCSLLGREADLSQKPGTNNSTAPDDADGPGREPPRRCGSAPAVPACPAGTTGPGCALTCDRAADAGCSATERCGSDGRVVGLSGRRAFLFRATPDDAAGRFVDWVTAHPSALGLRRGLGRQDLQIERLATSRHGKFTLIRLTQRYRGLPVLGPEGVLMLSGHDGVVSLLHGVVLDGAEIYANLDAQCPIDVAARALQRHAASEGVDPAEIELHDLRLHALASSRRVVWASDASLRGAYLGRFAVDAAPVAPHEQPRLVYLDRDVHAGLEDEVPVTVLGLDLDASPYGLIDELATKALTTLSTGNPLEGSTLPEGTQLGSPRVFMRDLHGQTLQAGLAASTRFVSPDGKFLAPSDPEFAAQRIYHLFQSFYDISDRYLSAPGNPALKQWDSHRGEVSSFAPGKFQPRIAVFTSSGESCLSQPACAGSYDVLPPVPPELFEFAHSDVGSNVLESLGYTHFKSNTVTPDVIAHEFGHVADTFLFPGVAKSDPCTVGVDCVAKCVEDTPDEAPALSEAVAQMLALLYLYEASGVIDAQDCDAVDWVTKNGGSAETPGPCMADLGQIAFMVRDVDCPTLNTEFCDKPATIGTATVCCDLDADPDCMITEPDCAGGGTKQMPTGACSPAPGYRSNSTLEAFWQLLIGQVCSPAAPFKCVPITLPKAVTPSEAAARALFYALRVGSRSFRQLFDAVASYYSCEYGTAAYEGVRAVFCNHRIMDCDAPPPTLCGECGDGVVDVGEQCDLTTIPVTCQDLGYDGGVVTCNVNCEVEKDHCHHAAPTGAGPTTPDDPGPAVDPSPAGTGPDSAGTMVEASDSGGCSCQQTGKGENSAILGLFGLVLAGTRRRRS